MAVLKGFTYDGIKSVDYGVIVTGANVYDAPERDVSVIEVQGRNGNLVIDKGRYKNISVVYHCAMIEKTQADFSRMISDLRNQLASRTSYARLTDDYNVDEYRLGMYKEGLEVDADRDLVGEFDLIFDCKPQRFLTSGEDTITVGDWGDVTEYSGDIVSFEGDEMTAIKSLSVSLSPIQNLNGYDHPWVGGAGKNKLQVTASSQTISGIVFTVQSDGTITARGTATQNRITFTVGSVNFKANTGYVLNGCPSGGGASTYNMNIAGAFSLDTGSGGAVYTPSEDINYVARIDIYQAAGEVNLTFRPMIRLASVTDSTWEPYSNICPITGWDGVSVPVAGKNLLNPSGFQSQSNVSINDGVITATADDTLLPFSPVLQAYNNSTFVRNLSVGTPSNPFQFTKDETFNRLVFGHNGQARDVKVKMDVSDLPDGTYLFSWRTLSDVNRISWDNMMIRLASDTDNTYEPYQGETITQEFVDAQGNTLTVYGGEDEIVGGVLTDEYGDLLTFDGNNSGMWRGAATSVYGVTRFYTTPIYTGRQAVLSDSYRVSTNFNSDIGIVGMSSDNRLLVIPPFAQGKTLAEFKTLLADHPFTVLMTLATPITYTLTPQQVETLIGTNNVWSDAGEVTVEIADDPNKIVNPTLYDARPLIKVSGYGTVQVGSVTITIEGSASDVTYIDCDSMECYRLNGLAIVSANSAVSFSSYDFPVLEADAITGITYSTNISQVQIVPRWWQL